MISSLTATGTKRAETVMTFASLCARASLANSGSVTLAARTPSTLLAAIAMPIPVPHTSTPASASPAATYAADLEREVGVVDRLITRAGAHVIDVMPLRDQVRLETLLLLETGMIGAECDAHRELSPLGVGCRVLRL